jgi:uncharacterized protein (TIGR02453 family)
MNTVSFKSSSLQFLVNLSKNNNRDWFTAHKDDYIAAQENAIDLVDTLIVLMNKHDQLENESGKKSLFRIYKDVRFSKDKTPYNPRFACGLNRAEKFRRGGYYLNIQPGNSALACGFFSPEASDLLRIRKDIEMNYPIWETFLESEAIKKHFGGMKGDTLQSAPRGFAKDHPAIHLIRHKQFLFSHDFTDEEVVDENFVFRVDEIFQAIRPYFDYMSSVLTTNVDGEDA